MDNFNLKFIELKAKYQHQNDEIDALFDKYEAGTPMADLLPSARCAMIAKFVSELEKLITKTI